ncbi:hypothetical protein ACOAPY_10620 [Pseudomonas sp. P3C3]
MHQWINLTTRYGNTIANPTSEQLKSALQEIFSSKDDEHPDCWIECGTQAGELHTLSVFSSGYAIFTRYSDFDMSEEIESRKLPAKDISSAQVLWTALINARYGEL